MSLKTLLFLALIALPGCASKDNVRIEYREKLVPVQTKLDPRLTTAPQLPAAPPFRCTDPQTRKATVCEEDHYAWDDALLKIAKDAIDQIKEIAGLQP